MTAPARKTTLTCPAVIMDFLTANQPGRDRSAFRYAVRQAVGLVLEHERTGQIAVPCTTADQAACLGEVSRLLAAIPCTCPGATCPRHETRTP